MIKIEYGELSRLNSRTSDIISDITSEKTRIQNYLDIINNNISINGEYTLSSDYQVLKGNIESGISDAISQLTLLNDFLQNQVDSYKNIVSSAYERLKEYITKVNSYLNGESIVSNSAGMAASTSSESQVTTSVINDNTAYSSGSYTTLTNKLGDRESNPVAWNTLDSCVDYYREKGYSDEQIAGMLGNAAQESGLTPTAQNSSSSAHGIYQWLSNRYPSDWSLDTQLSHSVNEINTRTDMSGNTVSYYLNKCTTVDDSTETFATFFEGYTGEMYQRKSYANAIYKYIKDNL